MQPKPTPKPTVTKNPDSFRGALRDLLCCRPMAYYPRLAELCGSVKAAVMLSQLLYWTGDDTVQQRDGWFYKSQPDLTRETGLVKVEQQTARAELVERGIIKAELRGMPRVWWYQVDMDRLTEMLAANPFIGRLSHPMRKSPNEKVIERVSRPTLGEQVAQQSVRKSPNVERESRPTPEGRLIESETTTETTPKTTTEITSSSYSPPTNPRQEEEEGQKKFKKLDAGLLAELEAIGVFPEFWSEIESSPWPAAAIHDLIVKLKKQSDQPAGLLMYRIRKHHPSKKYTQPAPVLPTPAEDAADAPDYDPVPAEIESAWSEVRQQHFNYLNKGAYVSYIAPIQLVGMDGDQLIMHTTAYTWNLYLAPVRANIAAALGVGGIDLEE